MNMSEKIQKAVDYMTDVYLKQGRDFISPTEIGNQFGGHSAIGSPICKKAVTLGIMLRNDKGHYCLVQQPSISHDMLKEITA